MATKKQPKIVLIEWVDSYSIEGWQFLGDCKLAEIKCQTVGFFVHETKNIYVVAQSRTTKGGFKPFADLISIPKVAITKMVEPTFFSFQLLL